MNDPNASELAMEMRGDVKPTRAGALHAMVDAAREARDPIQQRIDYYREKYFGRDVSEVMVLVAIEEAGRVVGEAAGDRASEIIESYEAMLGKAGRPLLDERVATLEARIPPADTRPTVYRGDVLLTLGHEIAVAGQQLRDLTAFRDRVVAAASDPAAWMLLRQELAS